MTTSLKDVADAVYAHVESGAPDDRVLWAAHYAPHFTSIEADGMTHSGVDEVAKKQEEWFAMVEMHGCTGEGPYVGHETSPGSGTFSIRFTLDFEMKDGSMPRTTMTEIAVYSVDGGKVVREEFLQMGEGC